jgi:hypothetical protein
LSADNFTTKRAGERAKIGNHGAALNIVARRGPPSHVPHGRGDLGQIVVAPRDLVLRSAAPA